MSTRTKQSPAAPPPVPLWTMADAAVHLGVNPETIRRMIARGQLRAYRYGNRLVRIDPADVERMRRPIGGRPA